MKELKRTGKKKIIRMNRFYLVKIKKKKYLFVKKKLHLMDFLTKKTKVDQYPKQNKNSRKINLLSEELKLFEKSMKREMS